jgi:hypothetical protein
MADEPDDKQSAKRDLWGKAESLAKILAGIAVSIGSIAIPYIIGKTSEQSRRAQVYMQVMSEREKADTAIRQEMFKTLLTNYLGSFETDKSQRETLDSFRRRIMFLDLLNLNFQEYLNAKPLFEDVFSRLEKAKKAERKGGAEYETLGKLQEDLIEVAKNVASRQSSTLALAGLSRPFDLKRGEVVCVRLYAVDNLRESTAAGSRPLEGIRRGSCSEAKQQETRRGDKVFSAIDVELQRLSASAARVKVTPQEESFDSGNLISVKRTKPLDFDVSYFDLPYMDNTRLFDGSRFALVLSSLQKEDESADLNVIIFKGDFTSLRDRPLFEEMLQKLNAEGSAR